MSCCMCSAFTHFCWIYLSIWRCVCISVLDSYFGTAPPWPSCLVFVRVFNQLYIITAHITYLHFYSEQPYICAPQNTEDWISLIRNLTPLKCSIWDHHNYSLLLFLPWLHETEMVSLPDLWFQGAYLVFQLPLSHQWDLSISRHIYNVINISIYKSSKVVYFLLIHSARI